jgi:hypothetical protein
MLHGAAYEDEELQPRGDRQVLAVAVVGDRHAPDQLHHEVGAAALGRAGVEHPGDVGVIHQRQSLALGLEASDDLLGVHAGLDHLERHLTAHRVRLLCQEHGTHAPLADRLHEPVGADAHAGSFEGARWAGVSRREGRGYFEKAARALCRPQ